jgi:hypothetical protein
MLQIAEVLRGKFGPRCVVHGLMCKPGQPWDGGYYTWLERATVILVLLSPSYFGSQACKDEFLAACNAVPDSTQNDKLLLPVVVTSLPWKYPNSEEAVGTTPRIRAKLNQRNCYPNPAHGALMDSPETHMPGLLGLVNDVLNKKSTAQGPKPAALAGHMAPPIAAPPPAMAVILDEDIVRLAAQFESWKIPKDEAFSSAQKLYCDGVRSIDDLMELADLIEDAPFDGVLQSEYGMKKLSSKRVVKGLEAAKH